MLEIQLEHPVNTIEGKELAGAGTIVTEDVVREIVASNDRPEAKSIHLMQFGMVKKEKKNRGFGKRATSSTYEKSFRRFRISEKRFLYFSNRC